MLCGGMQVRNGEGVASAPPPGPAEKLLGEWPELEAFGVDCVKRWLVRRERLIEIAKTLRRFPWMVGVARRRPLSILHSYTVEVYVARDVEGVLCPKRLGEGGQADRLFLLFEEQRRVGIDYAYYIL